MKKFEGRLVSENIKIGIEFIVNKKITKRTLILRVRFQKITFPPKQDPNLSLISLSALCCRAL